MLVFRQTDLLREGVCDEAQSVFGSADRGGVEASGVGDVGGGSDPQAGRISAQTVYRWKKQYAGMQPDQVRELKPLREDIAQLKKLGAEPSLDNATLRDAVLA
jgi:hypothetical protein